MSVSVPTWEIAGQLESLMMDVQNANSNVAPGQIRQNAVERGYTAAADWIAANPEQFNRGRDEGFHVEGSLH